MKRVLLTILALLVLSVSAQVQAANHYVRIGSTNNGDGTSWANAVGAGQPGAFNALPATLTRGDTYYLSDGSYGSYTFNDAVSGSTYIYLKKATASSHGTEVGWSSSYGDGVATFGNLTFTTSYWDIDGIEGSSNSGHLIKVDTTAGDACIMSNCSYIRFTHVEFDANGQDDEDIIYANSVSTQSTNLYFGYCYMHDCGRCQFLFRNTSDSTIEYGWFEKNHWDGVVHAEGISAYSGNTGNIIVRHNTWVDISGTGTLMIAGDGWEIYGNLMYWTGGQKTNAHSDCAIGNWGGKDQGTFGSSDTKIYNNTICDISTGNAGIYMYSGESGNVAYNNLWVNNYAVGLSNITQSNNTTSGSTSLFTDYSGDDFTLTQATDEGKGDLGSPYNVDMSGNTRGSDGWWDRGAYEYGSGGGGASETYKGCGGSFSFGGS